MRRVRLGSLCCLLLVACGEKPATKSTPSPERNQPTAQPLVAAAPEAPVVIKARKMECSRVGASALRPNAIGYVKMDTVRGKFLVVTTIEDVRLFYRAVITDTVWTEIKLNLPDTENNDIGTDWSNGSLELSFRNLDHRGTPEVLATYESSMYGTGGGTRWVCVNLIDVSHDPLLLLSAFTELEEENFGRDDSQPNGRRTDADYERFTGWRRAVKLGPTLYLGAAEPIGTLEPIAQNNGKCQLTKLTAGHYRYQGGGLVLVRK